MIRTVLTSMVAVAFIVPVHAQHAENFSNPVIRGDIPDPSVISVGDTYYMTGTSSEWAPFYPFFSSKDLVNWKQEGHVFTQKPAWTSNSFWAPELFYMKGKLYCYYTARRKSDGVSYIGVAVAEKPGEEFTDYGPIITYGNEAIDAFIFEDEGQLYISWKAYGLDNRPIELLSSKLSSDGLRLEGKPFTLLVDDERIGMEGQYIFKKGGYYYIVYAAHGCCGFNSTYDVYVARSEKYEGPYEKYSGNPILCGGGKDFISCGHGTAVQVSDGRMFYLCHAYMNGPSRFMGRQPILQEMIVGEDGWVRFASGKYASVKQAAVLDKKQKKRSVTDFKDEFDKSVLGVEWTWNYPYSDSNVQIHDGNLSLSGSPINGNRYGTALCVRATTPEYSYETQILNRNDVLKGLTMYGDHQNLIAFGVQGERLILKSVRDGKETILSDTGLLCEKPYLKIEVKQGQYLNFYQSRKGKKWERIPVSAVDAEFTARWDRVARPGLLYAGDSKDSGIFSYFRSTA